MSGLSSWLLLASWRSDEPTQRGCIPRESQQLGYPDDVMERIMHASAECILEL